MQKFLVLLSLLMVIGCGTKKKSTYTKTKNRSISVAKTSTNNNTGNSKRFSRKSATTKADLVINSALQYSGVRYKFGGTTKKGMDCSGLLYVAFGENEVQLPRVSYNMAEVGKKVSIRSVAKGDLLFFNTKKRGRKINHVGMVVAVDRDEIKFIHASTSRGVIVSSLREGFWNNAFIKATRVL